MGHVKRFQVGVVPSFVENSRFPEIPEGLDDGREIARDRLRDPGGIHLGRHRWQRVFASTYCCTMLFYCVSKGVDIDLWYKDRIRNIAHAFYIEGNALTLHRPTLQKHPGQTFPVGRMNQNMT